MAHRHERGRDRSQIPTRAGHTYTLAPFHARATGHPHPQELDRQPLPPQLRRDLVVDSDVSYAMPARTRTQSLDR